MPSLKEAHAQAVRMPSSEAATRLGDLLGRRIVAFACLAASEQSVTNWKEGKGLREKSRTRLIHLTAVALLMEDEGPETFRAWLCGSNPQLEDQAPLELLHQGEGMRVVRAAESFVNGGMG